MFRDFVTSLEIYYQPILFYSFFFPIVIPFVTTVYNAPYGRFSDPKSSFRINGRLAWFLQEVISGVVYLVVFVAYHNKRKYSAAQCSLLILWEMHYANRSILHCWKAPSMAPSTLSVFLSAVLFNLINPWLNAVYIYRFGEFPDGMLAQSPRFMIGTFLFLIGLISNTHHDNILFVLKAKKLKENGTRGYSIPTGGLFEFVSCPNYLCEMVEWIGFAIATFPSPPAILFAFCTIANLGPRARATHKWYLQTFKDAYPSNRKAFIPCLL